LPGAVAAFIEDELDAAREAFQKRPPAADADARNAAEAFFRATVQRLAVKP